MAKAESPDAGPYLTDLLESLGGISPRRVVLKPFPGTATEKDLLRYMRRTDRPCELVEGTIVEKAMGYREGCLAGWILHLLQTFLDVHDLGQLGGAGATMRLMPKLVRIPDVSFVRWEKLSGRVLPEEAIPDLVPDLAIEVLSKGNTKGEMQRKLKEYFLTGVSLVWLVEPLKRRVMVCEAPDQRVVYEEADSLDGGAVLPGFTLPVARIFERLAPAKTPRRRRRRGEQ